MKAFVSTAPALEVSRENDLVVIQNEFVKWVHDPEKGGELCGAFVKYGSNKNLLLRPQSTAVCPWVKGGWRQYRYYETVRSKAKTFKITRKDDRVILDYSSSLCDNEGKNLKNVQVKHAVIYHASGAAEHTVTLDFRSDLDIGHVRIGTLDVVNRVDLQAVRPCAAASWAVELQNPCQWISLKHARSRDDLPAYQSRFLPLSVLLMQSGVEGIEMAMGDDLGAWDLLGTDVPGLARGAVFENMDLTAYEVVFAPLDSPRAGNIIKKGKYTFTYRLSLPYVRKNIVPLEIASTFLKTDFETRWPTLPQLKELKKRNMGMLRLHNDGDCCSNGIFWRDTDYPPYPADEMQKMDQALADANKAGIPVVPYFSVKEYHPDTAGFEKDAETFARQVIPGEKFLVNFFGTSLFGMQMCLCSNWYKTRQKTIEKPLENHAFSGLYYDWCMGLECINPAHNHGKRHWDNDQLLRLIEWSRQRAGDQGKLYLHLTNVPSFALENMANMVLTEESVYSEIFPEMFTPHVHFLNIAPRSICVMLPDADAGQMRALALAALLHHATLCTNDLKVLDFYKSHEKLLNSLCKYQRHSAPGEGITYTGSRTVGMSLYWKNRKALALLANLSNQEQTGDWSLKLNGKTICGTATIPALDLIAIEIDL